MQNRIEAMLKSSILGINVCRRSGTIVLVLSAVIQLIEINAQKVFSQQIWIEQLDTQPSLGDINSNTSSSLLDA